MIRNDCTWLYVIAASNNNNNNNNNNNIHQSYLGHAPESILFRAETEKKHKYSAAAAARRAHFTPLCFSVDGLAGSEAACFIKRIATGLSSKWERTTLKFCAGFVPDWRLRYCVPLDCV